MGVSGIDELYRDLILDHYHHPRNQERLVAPDVTTQGSNPLCGDEVEVALVLKGDRIAAVAFQGRGCSISQASASMMTESIKGKSVAEAAELLRTFKLAMTDRDAPAVDPERLGDLGALQAVRRYPVRVKCSLLAWNVLAEGLELYQAGTRPDVGQ